MTRIPSRLLNEKMGIFGLSVFDIGLLGYLLIFSHTLLSLLNLELIAFLISGFLTLVLISVRIKFRPKTIRDYILFKLTKRISFREGF